MVLHEIFRIHEIMSSYYGLWGTSGMLQFGGNVEYIFLYCLVVPPYCLSFYRVFPQFLFQISLLSSNFLVIYYRAIKIWQAKLARSL